MMGICQSKIGDQHMEEERRGGGNGVSQLGENGLDAHGLNTERARLGGGTSLLTA